MHTQKGAVHVCFFPSPKESANYAHGCITVPRQDGRGLLHLRHGAGGVAGEASGGVTGEAEGKHGGVIGTGAEENVGVIGTGVEENVGVIGTGAEENVGVIGTGAVGENVGGCVEGRGNDQSVAADGFGTARSFRTRWACCMASASMR